MMNTEKVTRVLRWVEWVGGGEYEPYCPWCARWQSEGHGDDCKLAALLSEGEKEVGQIKYDQR